MQVLLDAGIQYDESEQSDEVTFGMDDSKDVLFVIYNIFGVQEEVLALSLSDDDGDDDDDDDQNLKDDMTSDLEDEGSKSSLYYL